MKTKSIVTLIAVTLSLIGITGSVQAQIKAVDLVAFNTGTVTTNLGTVTFNFDQQQPSGTGVLDPFVRIQQNGEEQGYNTTQPNAGSYGFDEKHGSFTHDVTTNSLLDHDFDGKYEFVLDLGEPVSGTDSLLSLDGLKLWSTNIPGQNDNTVDSNGNWVGPADATLLWDLDADIAGVYKDQYILLDANKLGNPGNGVSDMLMEVPVNIINAGTETHFILWSRFGVEHVPATLGADSFGTFEEWATVVPEPSTYGLFGAGALTLLVAFRRFKRRKHS